MEITAHELYCSEVQSNLLAWNQYLLETPLTELLTYHTAPLQACLNHMNVARRPRDRALQPSDTKTPSRPRQWLISCSTVGRNDKGGSCVNTNYNNFSTVPT